LLDKKIDLAAIESPVFRDNIIYREWLEDELVLFSRTPLPKTIKKDDLFNFKWVCREWGSHTRRTVNETFEEIGVDCNSFDIISVVTSSTAVKQTILKSQIDKERPTVAIISRAVLTDELKDNILYESKVRNLKIRRKLYLAYLKDRKNDAYIENIVNYLMGMRSINF
ncbi:MAG: LysR substrate-binding domain-containing protein, partial [Campylobacterales bacterium]